MLISLHTGLWVLTSADQHAVAITVKAIAGGDGVAIGSEDVAAAGKRADHGE
jgi:hypothetical protein